jgi:hypothetical protein
MYLGYSKYSEVFASIKSALQNSRPACGLVQQCALRRTPSGHENTVKSGSRSGRLSTPLSVTVNFKPHPLFELRENLGVRMEFHSKIGEPDIVSVLAPEPPPSSKLKYE